MPKVSVIIPTYNRAHLVMRAIDSVLTSTYTNIDIIVVDDGSVDDTKDLINSRYGDRISYIYQTNKGAAAARNVGLKLSKAKYINFLDSDDYFLPDNIELKVKALEGNPELGWVFSDTYFKNSQNQLVTDKNINKIRKELEQRSYFFDILLMHGITNTNSVMMKKECIEAIGAFDEKLVTFEDVDLFYRVSKYFKGKYIDKALLVVDEQTSGLTSNRDRFYMGKIKVIEKTKKNFKDDVDKLGFPGRRVEADIFNYLGSIFLTKGENKKAMYEFLKSVKIFPLQIGVYIWLLKCLLIWFQFLKISKLTKP